MTVVWLEIPPVGILAAAYKGTKREKEQFKYFVSSPSS